MVDSDFLMLLFIQDIILSYNNAVSFNKILAAFFFLFFHVCKKKKSCSKKNLIL